MIVFIVLINDHSNHHTTAFYTWHDCDSEKHVSCLLNNSVFFRTKIMPSIEYSIVIIDQYCENIITGYSIVMQQCKCKSSGPDNISALILKQTAANVAPSITLLFNQSLKQGKIPCD